MSGISEQHDAAPVERRQRLHQLEHVVMENLGRLQVGQDLWDRIVPVPEASDQLRSLICIGHATRSICGGIAVHAVPAHRHRGEALTTATPRLRAGQLVWCRRKQTPRGVTGVGRTGVTGEQGRSHRRRDAVSGDHQVGRQLVVVEDDPGRRSSVGPRPIARHDGTNVRTGSHRTRCQLPDHQVGQLGAGQNHQGVAEPSLDSLGDVASRQPTAVRTSHTDARTQSGLGADGVTHPDHIQGSQRVGPQADTRSHRFDPCAPLADRYLPAGLGQRCSSRQASDPPTYDDYSACRAQRFLLHDVSTTEPGIAA